MKASTYVQERVELEGLVGSNSNACLSFDRQMQGQTSTRST